MKSWTVLVLGAAIIAAPLAVQSQVAGMAILKGQITAQGRIAFGNGISSVGMKGDGIYRLTLRHATNGCTFAVNVAGTTAGYSTVAYPSGDTTATKVDIHTFDSTGAPADLPFFFTANCAV